MVLEANFFFLIFIDNEMARCCAAGRSAILASFAPGLPIQRSAASPPELFPVRLCQAQTEPCALPSTCSGGASTEGLRARSQRQPLRASGRSAPPRTALPSPRPPAQLPGDPRRHPGAAGREGWQRPSTARALRRRG